MSGYEPEPMVDAQRIGDVDQFHAFADIGRGNAVMVLVESDIAVAHHRGHTALFQLIAPLREWTQTFPLNFPEQVRARFLASGHPPGVELVQSMAYGFVQRLQTMEDCPLHGYMYGAVHQPDGILHQGLILGMTYAGMEDRTSVTLGKRGKLLVYHRLVAVATCDC